MRYLLLCVGLGLPALGLGAVYKLVQPDGTVLFSDKPLPGAQEIQVPPANVSEALKPPEAPPPPDNSGAAAPAVQEAPAARYTRVEIISPSPETVLQNTAYSVDVDVLTVPPLQSGHRLVPILDGKPLGPTTRPRFQLDQVYRGAHTLQVQVQDADGRVLAASPAVTFYVKQMSQLFPNNPLNSSANPAR